MNQLAPSAGSPEYLVFGLVAHGLGLDQESTLLAYLYTVLTGLVAAALRLVPLGQSDGQRLLTAACH